MPGLIRRTSAHPDTAKSPDMKPRPRESPRDLWGNVRKTPKNASHLRPSLNRSPASQPNPLAHSPQSPEQGLERKYGALPGRVIGDGATSCVQILTRPSDRRTFAVKRFRARHVLEDQKEYNRKIMAEFSTGSMLRHGNIIQTIEILNERGSWYQVMEYVPYSLFECVMSGQMSNAEVTCTFSQLLAGVAYLHSMGFAHRDLKLENVVVTSQGIMKIIDFGSAAVFRSPTTDRITLSSGIVGSAPYLAPEITSPHYDPRALDVWALAIIYACMVLRRFPWQTARRSDESFKRFVSSPPSTPLARSFTSSASSVDSVDSLSKTLVEISVHEITSDSQSVSSRESLESSRPRQAAQKVPTGPASLLRQLPSESRAIIQSMLRLNPASRPAVEEVVENPWIRGSPLCSQDAEGAIHRGEGHTHTLCRG